MREKKKVKPEKEKKDFRHTSILADTLCVTTVLNSFHLLK